MTESIGPVVWGLPVLAWLGNAALLVLLVLCGGLSAWKAGRSSERRQRLMRYWVPWLATAALALVVGVCAVVFLEIWAIGAESGWNKVRIVAEAWSELLLSDHRQLSMQ